VLRWLGPVPTGRRGERLAQRVVNTVEPAVHVDRGGQRHERGDLVGGANALPAPAPGRALAIVVETEPPADHDEPGG